MPTIMSTVSGGKKMVRAVAKNPHMPVRMDGKSAVSKMLPQYSTGSSMYMSSRTSVHSAPDFSLKITQMFAATYNRRLESYQGSFFSRN